MSDERAVSKSARFHHQTFAFDVPLDWLPRRPVTRHSYLFKSGDWPVSIIPIESIVPLRRSIGVFVDGGLPHMSARERAMRIFSAFDEGIELPPIALCASGFVNADGHRYLYDGTHRLYCSIAAGFSHIPAIDAHESLGCVSKDADDARRARVAVGRPPSS